MSCEGHTTGALGAPASAADYQQRFPRGFWRPGPRPWAHSPLPWALAYRAVTVLINNAGISTGGNLLTGDPDNIRRDMDANFYGTLSVVRAFAPQIAAGGGGAILNILSALSWFSFPDVGAYCAAKSAQWSLTNSLRVQLADQGIRVAGLHVGGMDTDMSRDLDGPKTAPADVARLAADGLAEGGQGTTLVRRASLAQIVPPLAAGGGRGRELRRVLHQEGRLDGRGQASRRPAGRGCRRSALGRFQCGPFPHTANGPRSRLPSS